MKKQIVTFVINKDLDIKNHLIGIDVYERNKKSGVSKQIVQKNETLLKMPLAKRKGAIKNNIEHIYKKEKQLKSLARDVNQEWLKIEKRFIKKLEIVYKHPFPYKSVRGVLSSADRLGYGYIVKERWFATPMFSNRYRAIDIATHELSHFMFHKYYWKICESSGVPKDRIWDIKEAFTVLLNLEFDKLRFIPDEGYVQHQKLRRVIEKSWIKNRDFDKALSAAIKDCL
jgi:hypothetical protein